jgi:hypothetical protein
MTVTPDARAAFEQWALLQPGHPRDVQSPAAEAKREDDTSRRLRLRLTAEETLVSWETATGAWGTPSLIALRTAMARDVAALERRRR